MAVSGGKDSFFHLELKKCQDLQKNFNFFSLLIHTLVNLRFMHI